MAPAAAQDSADAPDPSRETPGGGKEQQTSSVPEQVSAKDGKSKPVNGTQGMPKTADVYKDGKPSNKELKEKSKAEKAARRAQEKGKQHGQPVVDLQGGNKADAKKTGVRRGSVNAPAPQTQHKRTGSTGQKALPVRPAESQAALVPADPKKEEKKVALFEHLYGHTRRTTLAGAGKDVHPAVLALGLQMSNYVICGSNARCVATMLVFKQVRPLPDPLPSATAKPSLPGRRILHHPPLHLPHPPPNHPPLLPN